MPTKYVWLLPVLGFWHILLHSAKALLKRYFLAGIQAICRSSRADDKHALGGMKYRRSHHWLVATFEGFWYCVLKQYMDLHKTDAQGGAVRLTADEVCSNVQPWLRHNADNHATLRLWTTLALDDMPSYLAMRFGARSGDYLLRLAGLREFALFFMGTGNDRYQWLTMNHLSDHARMPDSDVAILARMTSASWEDRPFANVALDECMEMFDRVIKQELHRITPGYIEQLGPIVENRRIALDEVEHRFYKPRKARNTVETLVKEL